MIVKIKMEEISLDINFLSSRPWELVLPRNVTQLNKTLETSSNKYNLVCL